MTNSDDTVSDVLQSLKREETEMAIKISLKRSVPAPFMPAPRAVQAGDYVFTSSIYPIDQSGSAVATEERGETAPSVMELQARHCLDTLAAVLKDFGSSLDKVLKADVHLVDPADFIELKHVWQEYFPNDPPARTTVEVGDTFPFRGVRLNLDAVALAGDSKLKQEVLNDPDGSSDALAAEWASHAVRAGNLIFCSAFTASDFKNGLAAGKRPGFPYYGSDAEMQAAYIFDRMNRVLVQAGTSLEQCVESQLYEPDLITFHDVDGVWARYMPVAPCRSSMGMKGLLVPGACMAPNLTVLVPDANHKKEESFEGIAWHPVRVRKVNFSPTIKAGPWRFFAGQVPSADFMSYHHTPKGLPYHFSNIEEQTRFTLEMLTRQLHANDTDWDHCHHVRLYLVEPRRDYRGFVRAWRRQFPDPAKAPALAFVPTTGIMFPGPLIEIDPSCVAR